MNGAQNLVQPQPVPHRQHILRDQITGMRAHDGDAQDFILARHRQHLHKTVGFFIHDGTIQIIDIVPHHLVRHILRLRVRLAQPHPRHFRIGEGCPGNDRIIHPEFLEGAEQPVHRRIPGLMRRHMRKLVRPRHIAASKNVGEIRHPQILIHFQRAILVQFNAEFLQPQRIDIRRAPHRHQNFIAVHFYRFAILLADHHLVLRVQIHRHHLVAREHANTFPQEFLRHHCGNVFIFAEQDARQHFNLRHFHPQPRKCLAQFATDGTTTQHHQPARFFPQIPHRVRREIARFRQTGNWRHRWSRPGGDHDAAGGQPLAVHFHFPRRHQLGVAADTLHPQLGVTLDRIMGCNRAHAALHPFHHLGKFEFRPHRFQAKIPRPANIRNHARTAQQTLAGHAAGVEAVAAHAVAFDQRHFRLHHGGDIGRHQPGRPGADHDQVAVEFFRLLNISHGHVSL